jgi:hypothetical protein
VLPPLRVSVPEPFFITEADELLPNVEPKVTLFELVSRVAAIPLARTRRLEMSWVLPLAHCSTAFPAKVILPEVPRPLFEKDTVPELIVVPPV